MSAVNRPLGVTILAILHVLQAVLLFLGGLVLIAAGFLVPMIFFRIPRVLGGVISAIGVILIIVGLLALLLAWGLWSGRGWAWGISLVLAILGIIFSLLSLVFRAGAGSVITLLLDLLIVYYLTRPSVKAFFGKVPMPGAPAPYPTATAAPGPQLAGGAAKYCSNCGAPVNPNEVYCAHCGTRLN